MHAGFPSEAPDGPAQDGPVGDSRSPSDKKDAPMTKILSLLSVALVAVPALLLTTTS